MRRWLAITLALCACPQNGTDRPGVSPTDPPAAPSFSLLVRPATVAAEAGGASPAIEVSVTPANGFAAPVAIEIAGLPGGVVAEPTLPLAVRADGTIYLTLHAAPEASPGTYPVTLRATSGAIESVRTITMFVAAPSGLPIRSSFVPTGAAPYRIAYDARTGLAFASMTEWNEVAVIAVAEGRLVARIPVPGCTSLHFSPGMSELVVGSTTEYVSVIDPLRLEVVERTAFPAEVNGGGGPANIPLDVVPLANGTWLVVANQQHSTGMSLVQWDRVTGRLVDRTPESGEITDATPSPDGTKVLFSHRTGLALVMYDVACEVHGVLGSAANCSGVRPST